MNPQALQFILGLGIGVCIGALGLLYAIEWRSKNR